MVTYHFLNFHLPFWWVIFNLQGWSDLHIKRRSTFYLKLKNEICLYFCLIISKPHFSFMIYKDYYNAAFVLISTKNILTHGPWLFNNIALGVSTPALPSNACPIFWLCTSCVGVNFFAVTPSQIRAHVKILDIVCVFATIVSSVYIHLATRLDRITGTWV